MQRHGPVSRFFVDVGAHHPIRFSNTWLFYQQGWRGLNIDPLPGSMREFDRLRPRDVNLELAISATPGPAELYLFDETAVSTLSRETADARIRDTPYRIQRTIEVSTRTLESVLDEHVPHGVTVDFMTIDVEGHELSVITSLDWSRWRPTFLLIESLDELTLTANQIACFVDQIGYHAVARTPRTMIYRDDSSRP
ncbi:MAG: FkbM family methyltransferase [Thermoanaerobaculales bacterium]|nr:FkbM family methyltransferase [Thermoanaerobaculales bacterium]